MSNDSLKEIADELNNISFSNLKKEMDAIIEKNQKIANGFENVLIVSKNLKTVFEGMDKSSGSFEKIFKPDNGMRGSLTELLSFKNLANVSSIVSGLVPIVQLICETIGNIPDPMKEATAAIREQMNAWNEMIYAQSEALTGVHAETGYYEKLAAELREMSDGQKLVGDEFDRARFIIDKLNSALGTNISLTEDGTLAYNDYADSIEKAISLKNANLALESMEATYIEARNTAQQNSLDLMKIDNELTAKKNELDNLNNDYKVMALSVSAEERMAMSDRINDLKGEVDALQQNYDAKKSLYDENYQTMATYEALQQAVFEGNYSKMEEIVGNIGHVLLSSANATTEELHGQYEMIAESYSNIVNGNKEVTQAQLEDINSMLVTATEELLTSLTNNSDLTEENIIAIMDKLTKSTEESSALLSEILSQQGLDATNISNENAHSIITALTDGLVAYLDENRGSIEYVAQTPGVIFRTENEINSPSKLFERYGKYIVEGLNSGIEGAGESTTMSLTGWGKIISDWRDGLKLPNIAVDVSYYTPASAVLQAAIKLLNLPGFPKVQFKKYALGGLVSPGELFIAREAGPELVGTIGGHTAVMNNNQIVESVSRGVAMANMTEAAILREVRDLLKVVASRPNKVQIGEREFGEVVVGALNRRTYELGDSGLMF